MPMKIGMAMADENGPPECESFVATCTLEFDDESSPPQDTETFQQVIHSAIAECCRVVHEELRRQRTGASQVPLIQP